MKILSCKVDMRNKLYEIKFFELCSKKMELMKQIHLFEKGLVIFLKGATFSDFIETGLLNYKPLAIWIRFPLFRRFFLIRFKPHQVVLGWLKIFFMQNSSRTIKFSLSALIYKAKFAQNGNILCIFVLWDNVKQ